MLSVDRTLYAIRSKVEAGQRLSREDGEFLFRPEVDLHAIGQLADRVRQAAGSAAKRAPSHNTFAAWREVTPQHNALIDAMIGAKVHVRPEIKFFTTASRRNFRGSTGSTPAP